MYFFAHGWVGIFLIQLSSCFWRTDGRKQTVNRLSSFFEGQQRDCLYAIRFRHQSASCRHSFVCFIDAFYSISNNLHASLILFFRLFFRHDVFICFHLGCSKSFYRQSPIPDFGKRIRLHFGEDLLYYIPFFSRIMPVAIKQTIWIYAIDTGWPSSDNFVRTAL